jgi:hypothetical protein
MPGGLRRQRPDLFAWRCIAQSALREAEFSARRKVAAVQRMLRVLHRWDGLQARSR